MKRNYLLILFMSFILLAGSYSCQKDYLENAPSGDDVMLKKGSKPSDVEQGDLYGDLLEVERNYQGVPEIYPLNYEVEYQDEIKTGIIDVLNPRLDGSFNLFILDKYINTASSSDPAEGDEPGDNMVEVYIDPGEDGFLGGDGEWDPVVLYDGEGELLAGAAEHIFPVEEGRLNLVRSPRSVIEARMTEVIKNFGNGTVADVVKDYCGRLYMIRTQGAVDTLDLEDKPIDSPLENLAIYWELMNYGFSRSADERGLTFLVANDMNVDGFRVQSVLDNSWNDGPKNYMELSTTTEKQQFVANLAAAAVAAASDKSNFLTFDEIAYLNQFIGIPHVDGFDSSIPFQETTCFFPTVCQEVRMLNKTNKEMYKKYRYFVDYSAFSYNRDKFKATYLDLVSVKIEGDSIFTDTIQHDLVLDDILSGSYSGMVLDEYRYTDGKDERTGPYGFSNQADDYVQALEVIHNNEEFLRWQMPTPTWRYPTHLNRSISPFSIDVPEESHGNKPPGKGDDESATTPTTPKGKRGS